MDISLRCDGCGQTASSEHVASRLQRLEWTTRYRPVHIGTVLISAVSPTLDSEFFYSPNTNFSGEAGIILSVTGISPNGKSAEAVQAEFQRAGLLLSHVLECPINAHGINGESGSVDSLLWQRIPFVATRIRRSLKPKRVALVSNMLQGWAEQVSASEWGCDVILDGVTPFRLDHPDKMQAEAAAQKLRHALIANTQTTR